MKMTPITCNTKNNARMECFVEQLIKLQLDRTSHKTLN